MRTKSKLTKIIETIVDKKLSTRLNEAVSDYTSVFESINWDNVASEILKKVRVKTNLSFELRRPEKPYVEMHSDNIIDQCGIFKYAINDCRLGFFSNGLKLEPDENGIIFWAGLRLSYPGNGMTFGYVWVKQDGQVLIELDRPRGK